MTNTRSVARHAARQLEIDPVGWRKKNNEKVKRWRKNNQHKRRAHNKVYRAIKSGRLVRPETCQDCGKTCRPEAAHTDYDKPLDVLWLCHKCHMVMDLGAN